MPISTNLVIELIFEHAIDIRAASDQNLRNSAITKECSIMKRCHLHVPIGSFDFDLVLLRGHSESQSVVLIALALAVYLANTNIHPRHRW
jgi:hypothetical protein